MEKPDILCLSEANIYRSDGQYINYFEGYYHELNLESKNIDISRNSILINKNLNYTRRYELEDENICDIVLEITSKGNNPVLILGSYREWQKPKICNQPNSKSAKCQLNRFRITMKLWETLAAENKNLIILTDDNIDSSPQSIFNRRYNIKLLSDLLSDTE